MLIKILILILDSSKLWPILKIGNCVPGKYHKNVLVLKITQSPTVLPTFISFLNRNLSTGWNVYSAYGFRVDQTFFLLLLLHLSVDGCCWWWGEVFVVTDFMEICLWSLSLRSANTWIELGKQASLAAYSSI